MLLINLSLQNFRNYTKQSFSFSPRTTVILGANTAGKTNLLDALHIIATGKSFVAEKDEELVRFGEEFARIKSNITDQLQEQTLLEVLITCDSQMQRAGKRFFVNGVAKRRTDFTTYFPVLLFTPMDLDIINGGPSLRRNFLDHVLEQVDPEYRRSVSVYLKALRQRNALLEITRETGVRNDSQFHYWDDVLITHGNVIHTKRQEFIQFVNDSQKDIISCSVAYDHSIISEERLRKYRNAEIGSAMTLVGPHRDDILIFMSNEPLPNNSVNLREAKLYASRGQQRLVVLQLKLLQLRFMQKFLHISPLLLLDDIFSELDSDHIRLIWEMIGKQQTIITTTHEEFIEETKMKPDKIISLGSVVNSGDV